MFNRLPISINNYYGDPTMQWGNTIDKVSRLNRDGHIGPVAVILKGMVTFSMAQELKANSGGLKLVVLVSISNMPMHIEPVPRETRYSSMKNLVNVGIPTLGYFRPLTGTDDIESILINIKKSGIDNIIVSGFRGDKELADRMDMKDFSIRVKKMPRAVKDMVNKISSDIGIRVFDRTACGCAYVLGMERSWNPYQSTPHMAGCLSCPLKETCFDVPVEPTKESLEFVRSLGFDLEFIKEERPELCTINPDNRTACPSCCTTCWILKRSRVNVNGKVNLGVLAYLRFLLGGILVSSNGIMDDGSTTVGHVNFPRFKIPWEIHALNTWVPIASEVKRCFGCAYCIAEHYDNELKEYGCYPSDLERWVKERIKNEKK